MKILVVCQYYYPEPVRITDICEELVERGHEVTVLTGVPNYPEGEIYNGYDRKNKRSEIINGVNVIRSFTIPRKTGAFFRILNYYSYAMSSTMKILFNKIKPVNSEEFDVVFVNQLSPVMMANAGILYKKMHSKKLIMYCLDLWPESLVIGGIKRNSIIFKLFHKISKRIYCSCDRILVTSKSFIDYLEREFQIDKKQMSYLPQYAESIFKVQDCKKEANDTIDLMFAGNIGAAQSVNTIIYAAEKCKEISNLKWHIVGGGSELENVKQLANKLNLDNIVFYGRQPLEIMPEYYAKADAMIITMKADPVISLTLPGKVQTYMAAGKPIIGAIDGEAQKIINESHSGFCSGADDSEKLKDNVLHFIECKNQKELGERAEKFYRENFSKKEFFRHLYLELEMLIK